MPKFRERAKPKNVIDAELRGVMVVWQVRGDDGKLVTMRSNTTAFKESFEPVDGEGNPTAPTPAAVADAATLEQSYRGATSAATKATDAADDAHEAAHVAEVAADRANDAAGSLNASTGAALEKIEAAISDAADVAVAKIVAAVAPAPKPPTDG